MECFLLHGFYFYFAVCDSCGSCVKLVVDISSYLCGQTTRNCTQTHLHDHDYLGPED